MLPSHIKQICVSLHCQKTLTVAQITINNEIKQLYLNYEGFSCCGLNAQHHNFLCNCIWKRNLCYLDRTDVLMNRFSDQVLST